jgi:hypothetical protein
MDKCGCFDIDYPIYNDTYPSCILDSKNLDCNQRELESNQSGNNFGLFCEKLCPFECQTSEFIYQTSGNDVFI